MGAGAEVTAGMGERSRTGVGAGGGVAGVRREGPEKAAFGGHPYVLFTFELSMPSLGG